MMHFLSQRVDQGFAVVEIDMVGDVVDGQDGHQTAPVDLEKALAQRLLQLADLHARLVYLPAGNMDLGGPFDHQDIEDRVDVQHQLFPVGYYRDVLNDPT